LDFSFHGGSVVFSFNCTDFAKFRIVVRNYVHFCNVTNSMLPERIGLFFTNFPLVSVSQHNANSIAIFRHYIYFYQYNFPAILSISLRFVDRHIVLNKSAASMTL